jgi:hypothetical protein
VGLVRGGCYAPLARTGSFRSSGLRLRTGPPCPADYQAVLTTLGKQGDFKENVLRVNIPRNDLHVVIDGVATPTPFGFGGWLALTKGSRHGRDDG